MDEAAVSVCKQITYIVNRRVVDVKTVDTMLAITKPAAQGIKNGEARKVAFKINSRWE